MRLLVGALALFLILTILWDAFETVVLPRRVTRRVRWSRFYYRTAWTCWSALARRMRARGRREAFLGFFGPLSVIVLVGIWAAGLILGFALLDWALGSSLIGPGGRPARFGTDLYMSGTTFFTLGLGDVYPGSRAARIVAVLEAGIGFGFLALLVSYLPVIYQAFSRREVPISMLDQRAGSPPTAAALVSRHGGDGATALLIPFLQEWERWSADLLETHVSYPVLAYYRSQHDNQSWVAALTTVLDACALGISGAEGLVARAAWLTFAMARHAVVDLCQVLNTPPQPVGTDRLPSQDFQRLRALLGEAGISLRMDQVAEAKLRELRAMYEPYVNALSRRLLMDLPAWLPAPGSKDNWQKSAWR